MENENTSTNLEEELKKPESSVVENISNEQILNLLTEEQLLQLAQIKADGDKDSDKQDDIEKDEKEAKTIVNDTSNYKMPNPFSDNSYSDTETDTSKMFERARASLSDELELDIVYYGVVREIVLQNESYPKIVMYINVNDNGTTKNIVEEYAFGRKYDDFYMEKIVNLLRNIRNYQLNWVNSQSLETITNSMQFLVGAKVSVMKKLSQNNRTYNVISVLGEYNTTLKKIV